jgi:lysophospholipase L1-like esterase
LKRIKALSRLVLLNLGIWLALEVIALLILSGVSEPPEIDSKLDQKDDKSWIVQTRLSFDGGLYRRDEHCFWRLAPNHRGREGDTRFWGNAPLLLNEEGMRSPALQANRRRVLVLGGSHPMGMYADAGETYSAVLERHLNGDAGRSWQVLNAAAPGYTSYQGLQYLQHYGLAFKPEIVIFDLGANDNLPLTPEFPRPDHEIELPPEWAARTSSVLEFSAVYRLIRHWLKPDTAQVAGVRVPAEEHINNLNAAVAVAQKNGIKLLFMSQARFDMYGSKRVQCLYPEKEYSPKVDVCELWLSKGDQVGDYFADPIHANGKGHQLIGDAVHEKISELGWLK